jgi:hypothetical protein
MKSSSCTGSAARRGCLPPATGLGSVPFVRILPIFAGYQGLVVLEYCHDKYLDFNTEIAAETRMLLNRFVDGFSRE